MIIFLISNSFPINKLFKFMPNLLRAAKIAASSLVLTFSLNTSAQDFDNIAETYVAIAHQNYSDSLNLAKEMFDQIQIFTENPNEANLANAKSAWRNARVVYSQTETFRFAHPVVDEWEVQVNAWPLDEGFIDYVDDDNYFYELGNPVGQANIVASEELRWGPNNLNLSELTPALLASLNELGGTEANVATGWHAIEFLLWGQDLNGTQPGAGERPATDYAEDETCTNGNCARRAEYLFAVTELLISDLNYIVDVWNTEEPDSYATEFLSFNSNEQLRRILYGMGSLSLGELAGERMKVALFANSTEDEHDCFSDNTHATLYYNAKGIDNVLRGHYVAIDGQTLIGPSLLSWAESHDGQLASNLDESFNQALSHISQIVESAESGVAFDQLIAPGNSNGSQLINASINALTEQTRNLELLANAMQLGSLNPDNAGHDF